MNKVGKELSKI